MSRGWDWDRFVLVAEEVEADGAGVAVEGDLGEGAESVGVAGLGDGPLSR